MNAHKSLEASIIILGIQILFSLFYAKVVSCSGWVQTVFICEVGSRNCVVKAKVKPSQRLTSESHQAWVALVKSTGAVVTGHCTCMAG